MKRESNDRFRRWFRRLARLLLVGVLLALGMICYAYFTATWASRGRLFTEVSELPATKVGMVFGTTDRMSSGRENLYFRYRMDAAVRVWKSGRSRRSSSQATTTVIRITTNRKK